MFSFCLTTTTKRSFAKAATCIVTSATQGRVVHVCVADNKAMLGSELHGKAGVFDNTNVVLQPTSAVSRRPIGTGIGAGVVQAGDTVLIIHTSAQQNIEDTMIQAAAAGAMVVLVSAISSSQKWCGICVV